MKWNDVEKDLLKDIETRKRFHTVDLAFEISKMIIDARLTKGFTQKELAEALGTKQPAIARLESGTYVPSFTMLQQIADVFDTQLLPPRFEFQEITPTYTLPSKDFSFPALNYRPLKRPTSRVSSRQYTEKELYSITSFIGKEFYVTL